MTDGQRHNEDRERHSSEEDVRRQEDRERRSDELREAWRQRHPDEEERERRRREKGGRE